MTGQTYRLTEIGPGLSAIECRFCGSSSANPNDVEHLYCGRCHLFHEVVMQGRQEVQIGAGHDCSEWRTARNYCALCDRQLSAPLIDAS